MLRETEIAQMGEGQREKERVRERERIPSSLHSTCAEPVVGLGLMKPQDHDLSQKPRAVCLTD